MTLNEYRFRQQMARRNRLRPGRQRNKLIYDDRLNAQAALVDFMRKKREKK